MALDFLNRVLSDAMTLPTARKNGPEGSNSDDPHVNMALSLLTNIARGDVGVAVALRVLINTELRAWAEEGAALRGFKEKFETHRLRNGELLREIEVHKANNRKLMDKLKAARRRRRKAARSELRDTSVITSHQRVADGYKA